MEGYSSSFIQLQDKQNVSMFKMQKVLYIQPSAALHKIQLNPLTLSSPAIWKKSQNACGLQLLAAVSQVIKHY